MNPGLQVSRYNVFARDPRDGGTVVFNGLRGTCLPLGARVAASLRQGQTAALLPAERRRLAQAGVLTASPEAETAALRARYARLQAPDSVSTFVISPTTACNLRCPYCYEQALGSRQASMSTAVAERVVRFVLDTMGTPGKELAVIKFYGGEPLLALARCRAMAAAIEPVLRARGQRLFTWIHTNGTLLGPDTFAEPFPALGCVELTIDGPRRLHDRVRVGTRGQPTFARVCAAVRCVAARDIPVVLRLNADGAGELREALTDLEAEGLAELPGLSFYDGRVSDCFDAFTRGDTAGACDQERRVVAGSLAVRTLLRDSPWRAKYQVYPLFSRSAGLCAFARGGNFCIDPHGDLYLCIFRQGLEEYRVGRLDAQGRAQFLPRYAQILERTPFRHPACVACASLPLCWGGCFAKAFAQQGSFEAPFCGSLREVTPDRIAAALAGGEL